MQWRKSKKSLKKVIQGAPQVTKVEAARIGFKREERKKLRAGLNYITGENNDFIKRNYTTVSDSHNERK